MCDDYVKEARDNRPYDTGHLPWDISDTIIIVSSVAIGFLMSLMMTCCERLKLKSVQNKSRASDYEVSDSLNIRVRNDVFLYDKLTKSRSSSSSDSDSGSSTHTGSSGTTHGGSSGNF